MLDISILGKWLFLGGLAIVVFGGLIWIAGRVGVPWGQLPGDIHIERDGLSIHFPLFSCVVLSILLTVVLNMIVWLWRR